MRKFLLSGAAIAAISIVANGSAEAATPVYNWTGCYIGGNVGTGWGNKDFGDGGFGFPGGSADLSGFIGGGQIGCDVQAGMFVFGVQGLFDWSRIHGQTPLFSGKSFAARAPWFGTATGRAGFLLQPNALLYVKGGRAWTRDEYDHFRGGPLASTGEEKRTGYTWGFGFDWMFAPNWSVMIEYGRMNFGTREVLFSPVGLGPPDFLLSVSQRSQFVLIGLNYRFNTLGR